MKMTVVIMASALLEPVLSVAQRGAGRGFGHGLGFSEDRRVPTVQGTKRPGTSLSDRFDRSRPGWFGGYYGNLGWGWWDYPYYTDYGIPAGNRIDGYQR